MTKQWRLILAVLLACGAIAGLPLAIKATPAAPVDATFDVDHCLRLDGNWDASTATCTLAEFWLGGWGLHVPVTMTLAISSSFTNEATIIGPGPGTLVIDPVVVDGQLVISGTATNYGPVQVNGRLVISGAWADSGEGRYVCDEMRDICVSSSVAGLIINRGEWVSLGRVDMPNGLVNDAAWRNAGVADTSADVVNRGLITNTGTLIVGGMMTNWGKIGGTGALTNSGDIWNWGQLSGVVVNEGTIYNLGVLSATVEGGGRVITLDHHNWLPRVRVSHD